MCCGIIAYMHVDVIPNRKSRPCFLIRETYRENNKIKHRTVKNISNLAPERIMAIKRALQGEFDKLAFCGDVDAKTEQGPKFGALYCLHEIGRQIGIWDVLGYDRKAKLAALMIIAQIIKPMSKRAVVRWARSQAVFEVLGLGGPDEIDFNEDELYSVLDWLSDRRFDIQLGLFRKRGKQCDKIFLYDVTSSYLEGQHNELADWGYGRDKKKGKKQIVIGLLTDKDGDPIAVDVFKGNTSDPKTVVDQIRLLSEQFGAREVIFVGDRGMLKRIPLEAIQDYEYKFITAITKPQIESLIGDDIIQLGLFDTDIGEVIDGNLRYIFRRNPIRVAEIEDSRMARFNKLRDLASNRSEKLAASQRSRVAVAEKKIRTRAEQLKIDKFIDVSIDGRSISVSLNKEAIDELSRLDGVYVLKTDVPAEELDKVAVHSAYKYLQRVENDFRQMKTDLEVRPVHVRKQSRTRGHVLTVMLALMNRREIEKKLLDLSVETKHAVDLLNGWTVLREHLGNLSFSRLPQPNKEQQEILDALRIKQPSSLIVPSKRRKK